MTWGSRLFEAFKIVEGCRILLMTDCEQQLIALVLDLDQPIAGENQCCAQGDNQQPRINYRYPVGQLGRVPTRNLPVFIVPLLMIELPIPPSTVPTAPGYPLPVLPQPRPA